MPYDGFLLSVRYQADLGSPADQFDDAYRLNVAEIRDPIDQFGAVCGDD